MGASGGFLLSQSNIDAIKWHLAGGQIVTKHMPLTDDNIKRRQRAYRIYNFAARFPFMKLKQWVYNQFSLDSTSWEVEIVNTWFDKNGVVTKVDRHMQVMLPYDEITSADESKGAFE